MRAQLSCDNAARHQRSPASHALMRRELVHCTLSCLACCKMCAPQAAPAAAACQDDADAWLPCVCLNAWEACGRIVTRFFSRALVMRPLAGRFRGQIFLTSSFPSCARWSEALLLAVWRSAHQSCGAGGGVGAAMCSARGMLCGAAFVCASRAVIVCAVFILCKAVVPYVFFEACAPQLCASDVARVGSDGWRACSCRAARSCRVRGAYAFLQACCGCQLLYADVRCPANVVGSRCARSDAADAQHVARRCQQR